MAPGAWFTTMRSSLRAANSQSSHEQAARTGSLVLPLLRVCIAAELSSGYQDLRAAHVGGDYRLDSHYDIDGF